MEIIDIDIDAPVSAVPSSKRGMRMRPYQEAAIEAIEDGWRDFTRQYVVLPTGCHAPGTPILMHNGRTKPVEDIEVGDVLIGMDSSPRTVLSLTRGRGPMYRITPVKGDPFVVDENHMLTLVQTNSGKRGRADGGVVDVRVCDYLAWPRSRKHLMKLFRRPADFRIKSRLQLIDPYFMGLLIGDGGLTHGINVTKPDPEVRAECEKQAGRWGMKLRVDGKEGNPTYHFHRDWQRDHPLKTILSLLELLEKTAEHKHIPHLYKTGNRADRLDLLAGLLDADGHCARGTGFDFISASHTLSNDVAFVARSVGLAAYVSECEKACQTGAVGTYWRVSISGDCSIIPNRVARKRASARQQIKDVLRTGFTIEPVGDGDFYGFTLDGDGRYLMGDFTVTHNCGKTILFSAISQTEAERGRKVLILAHRDELLEQAIDKLFRATGLEADKEKADEWAGRDASVVVASVQTLRQSRLDCWPKDHFGLIVTDEAHRSLAKSYQTIYEHFNSARLLGVTATPDRGDRKHIGTFYQNAAYTYSLIDAVLDGWLVRPIAETIPLEIDLRGIRVKKTENGHDFDNRELEERIAPVMDAICAEIAAHARHMRTVVFTPGVSTARLGAERLRALGIAAEFVSGACEDRAEKIDRYMRGEITHMFNAMLLVEGFDLDSIACVVPLRPTQSRGLFVQMIGRGTRPLAGLVDPLPTADERRAAIAASRKPRLLILDFFWQTEKHDLIRPVHMLAKDAKQAEAMQAKVKPGEQIDLLDAQRDAELAMIERLAEEVKKHSKKRRRTIDPLEFAVAVKDADMAEYEPESARDMEPPTPGQLEYLAEQGFDVLKVKYRGQASKLIERLHSRAAVGLCSLRQMTMLKQFGFDESEAVLMKAGQAGAIIGERLASFRKRRFHS